MLGGKIIKIEQGQSAGINPFEIELVETKVMTSPTLISLGFLTLFETTTS